MEVFRETWHGILRSPDREVFGGHPNSGKILVPIDLCILDLGNNENPDYSFPVKLTNAEIKESNNSAPIGKVEIVSTPNPAQDVYPIVTLNTVDLQEFPKIDPQLPGTLQAGDKIFFRSGLDNQVREGQILPSTNGISSGLGLIEQLPFPIDIALTIQAYRVQFNNPLGPKFQGSRIIMKATNKTLGMLLGFDSNTLLVFPASLI
jgi:hypothetical protein